MATFPLKIVCPEGTKFDGQVTQLQVRTSTGEMGILANHTDCVAPLGMGKAVIDSDAGRQYAACMGGIITVLDGTATIVCTTFEWAQEIDLARAERSRDRAQAVLDSKDASDSEIRIAEARLRRALIRKNVATFQ